MDIQQGQEISALYNVPFDSTNIPNRYNTNLQNCLPFCVCTDNDRSLVYSGIFQLKNGQLIRLLGFLPSKNVKKAGKMQVNIQSNTHVHNIPNIQDLNINLSGGELYFKWPKNGTTVQCKNTWCSTLGDI